MIMTEEDKEAAKSLPAYFQRNKMFMQGWLGNRHNIRNLRAQKKGK